MSKLNIHVLKPVLQAFHENINAYQHFVETGTLFGETIINLQPHFKKLSTVELSLEHFLQFNTTKQSYNFDNVNNYCGDSTIMLPGILLTASDDNIIFWLDGHYSAGDTAKGVKECPLLEECTYIDNFCKSNKCIILIDDCTLFDKKEFYDWSGISFDAIKKCFKKYRIVTTQVFNSFGNPPYWEGDIFGLLIERITPESLC